MKHLYAFLFLFLLATAPNFAQNDFRPGYILQNGDTVRGLINNHGDKRLAKLASFKTDEKAATQNFTPSEIAGYGITDGYAYEAKKVSSPDSTYLLFMRVLVKGPANLYFYKDQNSGDHYFLQHKDSLQELVVKKTKEQLPTGYHLVTDNQYKKTLFNAFKDCPSTGQAINKLPFKEVNLIEMVATYNRCVDSTSRNLYEVKARKSIITWGTTAGVHKADLTITSHNGELAFSSNLGFQAGVTLNSTLPWASENISAHIELYFANTNYEHQTFKESDVARTAATYDLSLSYLKLPLLIRYTYPKGKLRPFINGGMINGQMLAIDQKYTKTETYSYTTTVSHEEKPIIPITRNYSRGWTIGGGIIAKGWKGKSLILEARYEDTNGFSNTLNYKTEISQLQIFTGLYF